MTRAAYDGDTARITELFDAGVQLGVGSANALHSAAINNHMDTVRAILARAHPADGDRSDCLTMIITNKQHAMAALLIAAGAHTESLYRTLFYAAYYGQSDTFKLLLESIAETGRHLPAGWRTTGETTYGQAVCEAAFNAVLIHKDDRMARLAYSYGIFTKYNMYGRFADENKWGRPPTLCQLAGARVPMRTALRLLDGSELAPTDVYEYIYFPDHPDAVPA